MNSSFTLPNYQELKLRVFFSILALTIFFPFFWVVMYFFIQSRIKKNEMNKPSFLYHFVKDDKVFEEICESKCLISLTGGRTYATDIFNPYLGSSYCDKSDVKYVIVIDGFENIFKPILNSKLDCIHVWKWWKFYRSEWISVNKKDIGLHISEDKVQKENKNYRRFRHDLSVDFKYYIEGSPYEIESTTKAISRQKRWFGIGEAFMSLLALSVVLYCNILGAAFILAFLGRFFDLPKKYNECLNWALPTRDLLANFQLEELIIIFPLVIVTVISLSWIIRFVYVKLRSEAIRDRKNLQREKKSTK